MSDAHNYAALRHASVKGVETAYVVLGRWNWPDGGAEFCIEHLDRGQAEVCDDQCFPTEAEAEEYANDLFSLSETDWKPGRPC